MTKRIRRWILYVLVVVFLVLGGGVVLYAQGWRVGFSPATGSFLAVDKVGGIYVKASPADAEIRLNGKEMSRGTRIFERGTLINNLFPAAYQVLIRKDGYRDWSATLPVMPSFVTSRAQVVLVPQKGEAVTTTPVRALQGLGEELYAATDDRIFRGADSIPGDRILAGADDGRRIITFAPREGVYYLYDIDTATSTSFARLFPGTPFSARLASTTEFSFLPNNDNLIVLRSSSTIRLADAGLGTVSLIEQEDPGAMAAGAVAANRVAWSSFDKGARHSVISLYDLPAGAFLRDEGVLPGRTVRMEFVDSNTLLLLQEDPGAKAGTGGTLYLFALGGGTQERLAEGVSVFFLSPDRSAVAALDAAGVHLLSQRDSSRYAFLTVPSPALIKKIAWYKDRAHLFLAYPDRVLFLDLEEPTVATLPVVTPTGDFAYLKEQNGFYTLFDRTLMRFQFPD